MNLGLFNLGGYGQFVWPAFIFTFISFIALYIKTKKELQNQEKVFLRKYEVIHTAEKRNTREKRIAKKVLYSSSI